MFKLFNNKLFWKNAMKIAVPVAVQNLLFSSFTLIDTLFVSRLGDVSLSAVGMSSQWNMLLNLATFGICSGTGVFVSQFWGIKDKEKIHKTMGIALSAAMLITLLFFAFTFLFPQSVIGIFNKNTDVIREGKSYIAIVCFTYPALAINDVLSIVLRSCEKVRLPMLSSVVITGVNIFLDYCLIFGKLGFPQMGVSGAALATVIASWLGTLVIISVSLIQKNILITKPKNVFAFHLSDIRTFFAKAFPVMLNESLWGLGTFIFNVVFANMGYEYYASITIVKTFENMAFVFFVGFCSACSVMIGKSIGSGEIRQGIVDSKRFTILVPAVSLLVGVVAVIFREQIVSVFDMGNNISELTLSTAKVLILIYSAVLPFRMLGFTFIVGIFRAGGDTVTAAKCDLGALWLASIPATLIAAYLLKLPFLACYVVMYVFEDVTKLVFSIPHYRKRKWIKPVTEEGKTALKEFVND